MSRGILQNRTRNTSLEHHLVCCFRCYRKNAERDLSNNRSHTRFCGTQLIIRSAEDVDGRFDSAPQALGVFSETQKPPTPLDITRQPSWQAPLAFCSEGATAWTLRRRAIDDAIWRARVSRALTGSQKSPARGVISGEASHMDRRPSSLHLGAPSGRSTFQWQTRPTLRANG